MIVFGHGSAAFRMPESGYDGAKTAVGDMLDIAFAIALLRALCSIFEPVRGARRVISCT